MQIENNKKIYKIIMLIIVVALVTFVITTVVMYNQFAGGKIGNTTFSTNIKLDAKINSIKKVLEKDYLGEIDEEKLTEAAIQGYVSGLEDEYTEYFTKKEMEEFKTETEGNYVGIGIYMTKNIKDNTIIVLAPIKGSPAESAGIKSGDIIKKVNGKEYTGDDFENVSSDIKGKAGTKVTLEIQRKEEILNFEVERKKIDLYPIETEVLTDKMGYIKIASFDEGCAKEFKESYKKLVEKNQIGLLIIDLRNNGGGIVKEATDILDMILDKNSIMMITVNKQGEEVVEKAKKDPTITMPIVVLVNGNTASASEIFASALKENKKATVVGTTTYGKGVIQELLTLSDGSGLKVTTEEYYTGQKNKINKIGVVPDVEVELTEEEEDTYHSDKNKDKQLKKAMELLK